MVKPLKGDFLIEVAVQAGRLPFGGLGLHPAEVVPHTEVGDVVGLVAITHEIAVGVGDDLIRRGVRKTPGHDVHRVVVTRARGRIARRMVRLPGEVQVDADLEPIGDLAVDVRTDRVTLHIGVRLDTLTVEGTQRDVVVAALAAARDAQVGFPGRSVLVEDPLAPVRMDVVLEAEVLQLLELGVLLEARIGQFAEGEPLFGVHQRHRELRQVGNTVGSADRHGRLLAGTLLRGDVHHAVGGAGTVDGGGGRVLHHRHVLDVVGVQGREDGHVDRSTVEDEQRRIRGVDRVDTAEAHRHGRARLTGTGVDLQTGDLALQGVAGAGRRNLGEGVGLDQRGGTDHRTDLLGGTVTDHDGFLQEFGIVGHDDVDQAAAGHVDGLRHHSDAGEREAVAGFGGNLIVAADVGRRVLSRHLVVNGHPDQGFVLGVDNRTGDPVPEVLSSRNGKRRQRDQQR